MERLTFDGNFCDIAQCSEVPGGSFCEDGACSQKKVWERLKAYEDTGWTPEMLRKLGENAWHLWDFAQAAENMTVGRLKELAEADKDGRVVVPPCKVGDTVYFVNAKQILEFAVVGYAVDETGISWVHSEHVDKIGNTNERTFSPDRFGKNTFPTREEAEKALQEMEAAK